MSDSGATLKVPFIVSGLAAISVIFKSFSVLCGSYGKGIAES